MIVGAYRLLEPVDGRFRVGVGQRQRLFAGAGPLVSIIEPTRRPPRGDGVEPDSPKGLE